MGLKLSKMFMRCKIEKIDEGESRQEDGYGSSPQGQEMYFTQCVPLHIAALKGDWEVAESLLQKDPWLVRAPITQGGEIALHIAAAQGHVSFVDNLIRKMDKSDMKIVSEKGSTALCFAAGAGNVHIAKLMVDNNSNLPKIPTNNGIMPLYIAAAQGHHDMAKYLYSLPGFESWNIKDQVALLTTCIDSGIYDLAMRIAGEYKKLILLEDNHGETPLEVLARKPSASCRIDQKGWWAAISNTVLHAMKSKAQGIVEPCDAYELFKFLLNKMISQQDVESGQVHGKASKLVFIATEAGNDEFVVELILRCPDLLYEMNDFKHSIFHIAVSRRYIRVFNLIYELHGIKNLIATYIDNEGNNILHLAAKLAPQNQLICIPGEALQMQREVLWYKEVEKIVPPMYRKMKNFTGHTPYELFLIEHENLMKQGEKVMRQTAKYCMLVTMLIATVVFTTAFTVPGGYNNNTGTPILQKKKLFIIFPISEAVATLSSLTSMLMFLSILTSRYTEMDFLNCLPFWLVIGVMALFVSILAMMVSFCSCLLFYEHGVIALTALLGFFASVPIMFIILTYPQVVIVLRCSYGGRWLFRSNKRLLT